MQGRSLDAARLFYKHKAFYSEIFYARVAEKQDGTGTTETDRSLVGAYFKLLKWVSLQAGYGVLLPMQALENLKGGADNTEHWFYAQTNIAF